LKFGARARNSHRVRRQTASRTAFQFGKHGPLAADVCVARLFGLERGATVLPPNSPAVPATPQGRRSRWSVNVAVRPLFAGLPPSDEPHGGKITPGQPRGREPPKAGRWGVWGEELKRGVGSRERVRRIGGTAAGSPATGSRRGCARRGGEARDGGEPSSATGGRRGAVRPEARRRGADCRVRLPCAGLAARPQQCALGAQRGPEPANGGRSGAAHLGQSRGPWRVAGGVRGRVRKGPAKARGASAPLRRRRGCRIVFGASVAVAGALLGWRGDRGAWGWLWALERPPDYENGGWFISRFQKC